MSSLKHQIVFFGAGPVALASLKSLQDHFLIESVITKPQADKKITPEVLKYCSEQAIRTLTPSNKSELGDLFQTESFKSPAGVVVDYGIIIPKNVLESFSKGIINSHFSILPQWRGADPITFALLSGQKETGVSLMLIVEKLDEGPLLDQEVLDITPDDTTDSLTSKLVELSNKMLVGRLPKYLKGDIAPRPQSKKTVSYSRLLVKSDGQLDPNKTPLILEREIRAYQPWPKSYFSWNKQNLIITKAKTSSQQTEPGKLSLQNNGLHFGCKDGSLEILEIQPAGKKPMDAKSFINGYRQLLS